ncbi:MAG: FAD-linked oxidase C-terminal domain-containing protein [Gammaproteobacteria bacterium]|nr:FAD-linked oxidase C-terminal domain-containing protein [Gammaproteobacteria bacterium]
MGSASSVPRQLHKVFQLDNGIISQAPRSRAVSIGDSRLAARLRRELEGDVLFDPFARGRYSTDASIYQIEPVGVVVPKDREDIRRALEIAADEGLPVLPRGGGTSQIGQTVGEALVIDTSKYCNRIGEFDAGARQVEVEPGLVLDQLNRFLKPHGLFYPVDVSTGNRATLGGMAGNNSCGARSIRYGNMVHNVDAIDAILADGSDALFARTADSSQDGTGARLMARMAALGQREVDEIEKSFPALLRRVGGYNIDQVMRGDDNHFGRLLVGSEGTLAFFAGLKLALQPIPPHKVLGICHFPTFYQAMDSAQHIVKLDPAAVELVDRTMIELSREIPLFRPTVERFVKGEPDALLLVEFAGEDRDEQLGKLRQLVELMGDLGFADAVVEALDPDFQSSVWEVRKSGLNIMMSMKGEGKPVSFIEDCAVRLEDLAEYTRRLTDIFEKYGTSGTWYAHASVGCLHVRPILNMKQDGAQKMRAIMEETLEIVEEYKGSHSGEHGDGLARSEFHERMFGARMLRNFEEVKDSFDPHGLFNPGKIVRAPRFDDRSLFRYKPGYAVPPLDTAFDWSAWGGFGGAVEMCNNNGACRKAAVGVMCPSYRVTREEQHLVRGRANTLRLALSGQLGRDALVAESMYDTMDLCVGCKGCRRECPTGVDMAKMKTEFLYHYRKAHKLSLRDRLVAFMPRYAPLAARFGFILNLRDRLPGLAALSEKLLGLSARRRLPRWRADYFDDRRDAPAANEDAMRAVVLWVDSFNRYFEPDNARAAIAVLEAAGYRVHLPLPLDGGRALDEGRTLLTAGLVDEAHREIRRLLDALAPYVERGLPVIGLEPSSLLTLRDEYPSLLPGAETARLAEQALLLEEFLAREHEAGTLDLKLKSLPQRNALLHGHCHQKAFAVMGAMQQTLALVPALEVEVVDSSCCGMAGSFGYEAEHFDLSMQMAELDLLPAMRAAADDTLLVANGFSCRHQIADGARREARHVARILRDALA